MHCRQRELLNPKCRSRFHLADGAAAGHHAQGKHVLLANLRPLIHPQDDPDVDCPVSRQRWHGLIVFYHICFAHGRHAMRHQSFDAGLRLLQPPSLLLIVRTI